MKRFLALVLALTMLLCGCGQEKKPEQSTTTAPTQPSSAPKEEPGDPPAESFGCYLPDSDIETSTGGAVKAFAVEDKDYYDILMLGDGLLLLSDENGTVLTSIAPEGVCSTVKLKNQFLLADDLTVIPEKEAVAYYDSDQQAMILLDKSLQELERIDLPENAVGEPAVDADWSAMYYFTEDELRCLNLSTGIDRMLKQISYPVQEIQQLHFDGSVLECMVMDGDVFQLMMISTKNGELLYVSEEMPTLITYGDRFFGVLYESGISQYLFGTRGEDIKCLNVESPLYLGDPEMWGAVTCDGAEFSVTMSYYDLQSGIRTSAVELATLGAPQGIAADSSRNAIWFFARNEEFDIGLFRWDIALSETGETESNTYPYFTEEEPDGDGLQQIEERADALGREYGIRIRVYEDALKIQPSDYVFELEHMVPVYERYLSELEEVLDSYPDGFLKKVGSTSDNGKLTISLIGAAYGDNGLGSLDTADGVHFYNDGDVYIALVMGDVFRNTLCHELFHAIDTYVLSHCNIYDDWDDLNPKGFEYDNDYVANQFREDYQYLEDDAWFIDMYSMSYAKEDRARIMEYAMQLDNESYFDSPHLQAKLQLLCRGIRKAFGLQNNSQQFVWEQYLK